MLLSEQITLMSDQNHFCLDNVSAYCTVYFKYCYCNSNRTVILNIVMPVKSTVSLLDLKTITCQRLGAHGSSTSGNPSKIPRSAIFQYIHT